MRQLWLMVCAAFLMLAACTVPGAAPSTEPSAPPLPSPAASAGAGSLPPASGDGSEAQEAAGRPEAAPVQDPEGLTAALEGCVSFGEGEAGVSLKTAIAAADLLIVGGTSLTVYPAAGLIDAYAGHRLALVNKTATGRDARADLVLHEPIAALFARL